MSHLDPKVAAAKAVIKAELDVHLAGLRHTITRSKATARTLARKERELKEAVAKVDEVALEAERNRIAAAHGFTR